MSDARQLPRDVFLYLLMISALAASTISFGVLLFQFINLSVTDAATQQCLYGQCHNAIRNALAFLVIVFPVLVWVMRFLKRDIKKTPTKRDLPIRRWLVYLALFVASLIVIGDLVALVNGFLQGDLTTRFVLKVFVIFYLAGSVFYYYLKELHATDSFRARLVGRIAVIAVIASLVAGFTIAGSPTSQRERRQDEQRVQDLQVIQSQLVDRYWRNTGRLPSTLDELEDDIIGFMVPHDPETGDIYDYDRNGDLGFILCATFARASEGPSSVSRPELFGANWDHEAGRVCFERIIDPEQYRADDVFVPLR